MFNLGYPINVLTDHKALTLIFCCHLRNSRLTRWTLALQEFIYHISGPTNIVDYIYRNPVNRDLCQQQQITKFIFTITSHRIELEYKSRIHVFGQMLHEQKSDIQLRKII